MLDKAKMNTQRAEIIRLRYKYRTLIMRRKIKLSHQKAAKLIGPDCAYHLYAGFDTKDVSQKKS